MSNPPGQTKFYPSFELSVETGPFVAKTNSNGYSWLDAQESLVFTPPLTVEFEIRREFLGSSQTGTFRILNLSQAHQKALYRDRYAFQYFQSIQFRAGFTSGDYLPLIFNGTVRWSRSERRGTEFWTLIDAFDGGFAMSNSFTSRTLPPNATLSGVIASLNGDLIGTYPTPIIGTLPAQKSLRGLSLFGPTFKLIQRTLPPGVTATIDNNQLKVLANTDALNPYPNQGIFLIEADTGLLNPPVRSGQMIELDILFEPRITVGQLIQIKSTANNQFNGQYRVNGITHQGKISADVDGEITTHLSVWLGAQAQFNTIVGTSPQ